VNIKRTRFDLTSADSKIIGFDYQYFYFINALLSIDKGQTIGFEVKDDVHISLPNGKLTLIQLKHTIKKNIDGKPVNLTEKDEDLWKTISNWILVICDKESNRSTLNQQKAFVENTEFLLATNKMVASNKFITQLNKFKKTKIDINKFLAYLNTLAAGTKDTQIKNYINQLILMDANLLSTFLLNISFETSQDKIIQEIKSNIQKKMIAENRVNDTFNDLFSELKQDFFEKAKAGMKQTITFDEWIRKHTVIFENNRTTSLPIRRFSPLLPANLLEQTFVKELIEIGDIRPDDLAQITEFTEFMLRIQMQLQGWHNDGLITADQIVSFHRGAFNYWKNVHRKSHRQTKSDPSLNCYNAKLCLDDIRLKDLKMITTEIGIDLSNGEFYYLSNQGRIGWKAEWEGNY